MVFSGSGEGAREDCFTVMEGKRTVDEGEGVMEGDGCGEEMG